MFDPLIDARVLYFAATLLVAGVVFFVVCIAAPAWRGNEHGSVAVAVRAQLAWIAWFGLGLALTSGVVWLAVTAAGMSGRPPTQVFGDGVLWTVLTQTTFGFAWMVRFVVACILAVLFVPFFAAEPNKWIVPAVTVLAAIFAGALAWAGHASGGLGAETVIHPTADVLHLIAAATWVGALVPLAVLLAAASKEDGSIAIARTATTRFSTIGIISVATLLVTGSVNAWYLVGSIPALTATSYGRLLSLKLILFLAMVIIAAVNRVALAPRLLQESPAANRNALRQLRRNAGIEALAGAAIIVIVGVLGTMPPGSHANHQHPIYGALPADSAFVHIHSVDGMADVMIEPGRIGTARSTIRLWNDDFAPLDARAVTLTLTAPTVGAKPVSRAAIQGDDGAWQVEGVALSEPGKWTVTVGIALDRTRRLTLTAPIVIGPKG